MSAAIRRHHPLCADPLGRHVGRPVPAEDVHHIVPIAEDPTLVFDAANLISLCRKCHAAVERHGMPPVDR